MVGNGPIHYRFNSCLCIFHEGQAYAQALEAAGVPVELWQGRGQMHASYTMVDMIVTANEARSRMAQALRAFAGLPAELAAVPAAREAEAATAS